MNDFLQNLRGGQRDNRAAKTRRGFDNNVQQPNFNSSSHFHSNTTYQNPRSGGLKRPVRPTNPQNPMNPMNSMNPINPMNSDSNALTLPPDMVENILTLVETMVRNQEFLAAAHERRAVAEERKADSLEEIAEYLRLLTAPSPPDENMPANGNMGEPVYDRGYGQGYGLNPSTQSFPPEPEPFQAVELREKPQVYQEPEPIPEVPVKKRRGRKPKAVKLAEERAAAELELKRVSEELEKNKVKVIKRTKAEKQKLAAKENGNVELMSREAIMEIVDTMRNNGSTFDEVAQHLSALGQPTFSGRGEWHAQTVHRLCGSKKNTAGKK